MADTSLGGIIGGITSKIDFGSWIWTIVYGILIILVCGLMIWFFWWWSQKKKFNKHIVIFERIGKGISPAIRTTAYFSFIGNVNDRVLITKKPKMILPSPSIQTGQDTYWYYRREDGELVNFGIEDIDKVSKEMKVELTNQELAYERLALEEYAKQRAFGKNWLLENIGLIAGIGVILICLVFLWLIFGKISTSAQALTDTIRSAKDLQDSNIKLSQQNQIIMNKLLSLQGLNSEVIPVNTSIVTPVNST